MYRAGLLSSPLAYTPAEVAGRPFSFLYGPGTDLATIGRINQALVQRGSFRGELLCYRSGGVPVWCEFTLTPVPTMDGAPEHIAALLTEITGRKQREELIKEAEAKYRGMFENAVEGIYQSTPDGRYLAVNPALARMYGYDSVEELLENVSDIQKQIYVDPSFRERFRVEVEKSDQVRGLEYQVRRRDGTVIWISESARVVRDAKGTVRYYEGFIDDITQRKEAEAARTRLEKQVVQTQKMEAMGTLAGGIAHDFNNILCAMLGLTELALDRRAKTSAARRGKISRRCIKSADRARKDLVRQILTIAQPAQRDGIPAGAAGRGAERVRQAAQRHPAILNRGTA